MIDLLVGLVVDLLVCYVCFGGNLWFVGLRLSFVVGVYGYFGCD